MDKFTVISISVKLRNLKQYLDWLIDLSLHLTHTVTEFCVRQPLLLFPYCLLELLSIWIFRYSDIRNRFWELKPVLFGNLDIRIIRIRGSEFRSRSKFRFGSEFGSGFRSMFRKKETLMYLMNFNISYFLNKNWILIHLYNWRKIKLKSINNMIGNEIVYIKTLNTKRFPDPSVKMLNYYLIYIHLNWINISEINWEPMKLSKSHNLKQIIPPNSLKS